MLVGSGVVSGARRHRRQGWVDGAVGDGKAMSSIVERPLDGCNGLWYSSGG